MTTAEEPEVTTISEKGQVVIPQSIRKKLGIKPKNKFLIYGKGDTIIMKKLELPNLQKEWEDIFKLMDKKELNIPEEGLKELFAEVDQQNKAEKKPTEEEILDDIQAYRRMKREKTS